MKERIYKIRYSTSKEKKGDAVYWDISGSETKEDIRRKIHKELRRSGNRDIKIISINRDLRAEDLEESERSERDQWYEEKRKDELLKPHKSKSLDAEIARIARGK